MEQDDQAFPFTTDQINMMFPFTLTATERWHILRIVRLDKRLYESCHTGWKDKRFEAVAVALQRADVVDIEEVPLPTA